jgi:hypothetical protein
MSSIGKLLSISVIVLAISTVSSSCLLAGERNAIAGDPEIAGPAWGGQGAWRTKIQQVFDPASRTLSRRMYTIWDPAPWRNLDFVWTPDSPAADRPGRVSGNGHLIWRIKDKPTYDRSAVFAEYRGAIRNGRIEGHGTYLDATGLMYEGEWKGGLMHGRGTLKLPGGDEYAGQFRTGAANGMGRYIDVTGETYEGPFVKGLRRGRGTTTLPSGRTYTSHWINGKEGETSRLVRLAQGTGAGLPGSADDIRIGILVDKKFPAARREVEPGDLLYAVSNTANGLSIRPEDARLMSMWKEGGEIQLTPDEEQGVEDEYGVLSKSKGQIVPLKLVIEVRNRSAFPVTATGAYLDVRSSVTDTQPAIQLAVGPIGECAGLPFYRPKFRLENFGWGAAEQATLRFDLMTPASRPLSASQSLSLGRIEGKAEVDLEFMLRSAGANVGSLSRAAKDGIMCRRPKSLQTCLQDLKANGTFGSLGEKVALSESFVVMKPTGRLEYSWRDASGTSRRAASPFTATLPLAFLRQEVECGEGAGREAITAVAQQLRLDASNYRVPVSFRTSIPAGRTSQLILPIKAGKSSVHDFKVVLQLSDGREIRSQPVNLLYYVPSWFGGS